MAISWPLRLETPRYEAEVNMGVFLQNLYDTYEVGGPLQCRLVADAYRERCAPTSG